MGILSLYLFYLIAKRFISERHALFATALLSFDVIFFVHSSIFVLDMPSICFGLMGTYLYLGKRYKLSAVALGISFLMYLVGLGFFLAISIYHIATHLRRTYDPSRLVEPRARYLKTNFKKTATFLIVLLLVGGGGLWLYDLAYRPAFTTSTTISININLVLDEAGVPVTTITSTQTIANTTPLTNPIENMMYYVGYFGRMGMVLNFSASTLHPPWDWVLPVGNSLNAPHYYTLAVTANGTTKALIDWRSQVTPFVEYFCLPIVGVALFNVARKKDKTKLGLFLLCWISGTYVPFLIDQIRIFPHMTNFNYYILPTIPAFALGIPYFWETLVKHPKARDAIILLQLLLTIVFFLYYFPVTLIRT
jgi:hypothetical protein